MCSTGLLRSPYDATTIRLIVVIAPFGLPAAILPAHIASFFLFHFPRLCYKCRSGRALHMGFYLDSSVSVSRRTSKTSYPRSASGGSGLRFYNPSMGRWASRDPIGELGFLTVNTNSLTSLLKRETAEQDADATRPYCFVGNNPTTAIDCLGLLLSKV